MSDLAVLFLMSPVQDFLHAFPNLGRHQRFVTALIALTTVIEIARINPIPQDLVERRHRNFAAALTKAEPLLVSLLGKRLERVFSAREPLEKVGYGRSEDRIRLDDPFPVRADRVHVPGRCERGPKALCCFRA